MERKQKKKMNILKLAVVIIFLVAFAIYIMQLSSAKYVLADSISINFSKYYMEVIEPMVIEFGETPITTSFTVKNNNGTDYMTENLKYTISVQENTKWNISAVDGLERTIIGGSIKSDTPSVTITPKSGVTLANREKITIVLTVTSPYPDTKTIELTYINIPAPTFSLSTTGSWMYDASQLQSTSGGLSGSDIIINPNSTQFGPYVQFEKGTYSVTITGTNLENVNVDCVGSFGGTLYPISNLTRTPTQVTYKVTITESSSNVEFRTFTNSVTTASISQISVTGGPVHSGWYTNDVTVTIDKNSTDSSIQTQYQLVTNGVAGEWTNYTVPFTITTEGTTVVNIKNIYTPLLGVEKAGESATVKIDKTAPNTFNVTITGNTKTSITISGTTADQGGSGIAGYQFSSDDGATWTSSSTFSGLSLNTRYTLLIKAIDNAGNERLSNQKAIMLRDKTFYATATTHNGGSSPTWTNPVDTYYYNSAYRFNTTVTNIYGYARTTSNVAGGEINNTSITYTMQNIGTTNAYDTSGQATSIPSGAVIDSARIYTGLGVERESGTLKGGGQMYFNGHGLSFDTGLQEQSSQFTADKSFNGDLSQGNLPTRGGSLAFVISGYSTRQTLGILHVRLKAYYLWGTFTAYWYEEV